MQKSEEYESINSHPGFLRLAPVLPVRSDVADLRPLTHPIPLAGAGGAAVWSHLVPPHHLDVIHRPERLLIGANLDCDTTLAGLWWRHQPPPMAGAEALEVDGAWSPPPKSWIDLVITAQWSRWFGIWWCRTPKLRWHWLINDVLCPAVSVHHYPGGRLRRTGHL